jgi:Fe2+ or Zn2+ uptake regulation protein/AcrR family transcriptional regulator
MPVAKGARVDPAATRARILDTAAELFHTRGVHAVGVNEIAAVAGASKLSLYRYFPSKQQLVEAVVAERSERIHGWLRRHTDGAPAGEARVLSVFDLLIEWFSRPGYHGCAVINAASDTRANPATARLARGHLARYRDLLERRLGEVSPPLAEGAAVARQLLLLIEGATIVTAIDGSPASQAGRDARCAAQALLAAAARQKMWDHPEQPPTSDLTESEDDGTGAVVGPAYRHHLARLRGQGLRATKPRLAVLDWLSSHPHSTAAQVRHGVAEQGGAVSSQGVYDVLAACVEAGLVRRIEPAGSPARYETRTGDNHHHMICRVCGRVDDVDCTIGASPCLTPSQKHSFDVDEAEIVFWGQCPTCAASEPGSLDVAHHRTKEARP